MATRHSEHGKKIGHLEMSVILSAAEQFSSERMSDATVLLTAVEQGEPAAAEKLLKRVYEELRRLAAFKMAQQAPGQTLQATALVHEAWLRLVGTQNPTFKNRSHFLFGCRRGHAPHSH